MSIGSFPGDIMRWNVPWQLRLKHGWCMFYPDICLYNIKTWLNLFLALSFLSWYICRMSSFWLVWPNLHAESRGGLEYMGWLCSPFNVRGNAPRTTSLPGTPHTAWTYTQLKFYVASVEEGPSYHPIVIEPLSTVYIGLSTHPYIDSWQTNTIGGGMPSFDSHHQHQVMNKGIYSIHWRAIKREGKEKAVRTLYREIM